VAPIVVLSPHSDDGVLSLGASMARWARSGQRVELLTVFALDPDSTTATGGWDRRAGFLTEGEAARARREEDRVACAVLGVTPRWLPFGSVDYDRQGSDAEVWGAVTDALDAADVVLVPGFPLSHPDHARLRTMAERLPAGVRGVYAEQPYTFREHATPFVPVAVGIRDRLAKWWAVRTYRSQLPLLGMTGRATRRGPLRLSWEDERVEWPEGHGGPPV